MVQASTTPLPPQQYTYLSIPTYTLAISPYTLCLSPTLSAFLLHFCLSSLHYLRLYQSSYALFISLLQPYDLSLLLDTLSVSSLQYSYLLPCTLYHFTTSMSLPPLHYTYGCIFRSPYTKNSTYIFMHTCYPSSVHYVPPLLPCTVQRVARYSKRTLHASAAQSVS